MLGGRSAGARVACRTATALGAAGVLALAFPLHPPGRPEKSRADELTGAGGAACSSSRGRPTPSAGPRRSPPCSPGVADASVYAVPGDHSLKKNPALVAAAAVHWLSS